MKNKAKTLVGAFLFAFVSGLFATGAWAALPATTISGSDVIVSNAEGGSYGDVSSNSSTDTLTIAADTDAGLAAGTVLRIKSISTAPRSNGAIPPVYLTVAGATSASAVTTSGGFATANRDKITFSFENTYCLMKVGTASSITFRNSSGDAANCGFCAVTKAHDNYLLGSLKSTGNWAVLMEIEAEIVEGYVNFEASSGNGWGFESGSGSGKVYLSGYKNYMKTPGSNEKEIVLVDGAYTYALDIKDANSMSSNTKNQVTIWSKLSGDGTLTTASANSAREPVLIVRDASDFAGSINATAGGKLITVFSGATETFADYYLYNKLFTDYKGSFYVTASSNPITVPAGKTWKGNCFLNEGTSTINGTFDGKVENIGTLTVNGTVTGEISNSGSGTVAVNAGATITAFTSVRDFTGFTVDSSVAVSVVLTSEEYGKGTATITGATGISSITVYAPDGTTSLGTLTPDGEGDAAYAGSVLTSGLATWCDYEFNGAFTSSGKDTTALTPDTSAVSQFYNSAMLYTYITPWRHITYPDSWTAVVRCTVPKLQNAAVVMFGTYAAGAIGLIAGEDPETQMLLVSTPGAVSSAEEKHFTTLAPMTVQDATTAQHVYIFTKNGTIVNVYCDGDHVLTDYELESATLGGGLQVGSLHGGVEATSGVPVGITKFGYGESALDALSAEQIQNARIDCMRLYDYSLSAEQIAALSVEFPAVKLYRATVADEANTTWGALTWSPSWDGGNSESKVILTAEGDAAVALPATVTADEVQLVIPAASTLTLSGTATLAITQPVDVSGGTLNLGGTLTLDEDLTIAGKVVFGGVTISGTGVIKLANSATVGATAATIATPLGTYTLAEGTVVDAAYSEAGVKFIPSSAAVCSVTTGGATSYYTDLSTAINAMSETSSLELLGDTSLSQVEINQLKTMNYYINGTTITKAVAKIGSETYGSLASAVTEATDGQTVALLRASSEAITLNKAITLTETASFTGTLSGSGTLTLTAARTSAPTFDNWTGMVVMPVINTGSRINFSYYGTAGSTVRVTGISNGAWLANEAIAPVVDLQGDMVLTGFSASFPNTISKLTGSGSFKLTSDGTAEGYADGYFCIQDVSGFAGSIEVAAPGLAIGASKPASPEAFGQILLTTSATIASGKTWTAQNGIVLGAANATLTNTDGELPTAPATSLASHHVEATGTGPTVYSVVRDTVAVSDVSFAYGADYTNATVTATVTGDADAATLTIGGKTYNANVSNGTVTFENVAIARGAGQGETIYSPISYTVSTSAGGVAVPTTGGTGTTVAATTTSGWIHEGATAWGTTGSWTTNSVAFTPAFSDGKAEIEDATFTATTASAGDIVKLTTTVTFAGDNDFDISGAQAAVKLGDTTGESPVTTFYVWVGATEPAWIPVSAVGLVPDYDVEYTVEVTINYATRKYTVSVGQYQLAATTGGATEFDLAGSQSSVQSVEYKGSGTFVSLDGEYTDGNVVRDGNGVRYATVADAIAAVEAGTATEPLTVLYGDITVPEGWSLYDYNGTKELVRSELLGRYIATFSGTADFTSLSWTLCGHPAELPDSGDLSGCTLEVHAADGGFLNMNADVGAAGAADGFELVGEDATISFNETKTFNVTKWDFSGMTGMVTTHNFPIAFVDITAANPVLPAGGGIKFTVEGAVRVNELPYTNIATVCTIDVSRKVGTPAVRNEQNEVVVPAEYAEGVFAADAADYVFGTTVDNYFHNFLLGAGDGTSVNVTQKSGYMEVCTGDLRVGDATGSTATLTIAGGEFRGPERASRVGYGGDGTLNVGVGEQPANVILYSLKAGSTEQPGTGVVNVNENGVLVIEGEGGISASRGTINLNGGTIVSRGAAFAIANAAANGTVLASGKTTTFCTTNDITVNAVLGGTGTLAKTGPGALVVAAAPTATGVVAVEEGTLALNAAHTTASEYAFAAGTTLKLGNASALAVDVITLPASGTVTLDVSGVETEVNVDRTLATATTGLDLAKFTPTGVPATHTLALEDNGTKLVLKALPPAAKTVSGGEEPVTAYYMTLQAAIDAAKYSSASAAASTVVLLADNTESPLTLPNGYSVKISAAAEPQAYTYGDLACVAEGDYKVESAADELDVGTTVWTARDWYSWTLALVNENGATVTGIANAQTVSEKTPTVSFTVAPAANYKVTGVTAQVAGEESETLTASEGTYSYTLTNNVTITVATELDVATVTFYGDDGETVLQSGNVTIGQAPAYSGETPTKAATAQHTFTFAGWATEANGAAAYGASEELPAVAAGGATYYAAFTATVNKYTVAWNANGGTLSGEYTSGSVDYGTTIVAPAAAKEADAQYTYTFAGWTPALNDGDTVQSNVTYVASWTPVLRSYEVTFTWHGGSDTKSYQYGTPASSVTVPSNPPSYTENGVIYTFSGWTPASVANVTGPATYTAQYTGAAAKGLVITIADNTVTTNGFYATLAEAVGAAADGQTVVLLADVTLDARVEPNLGANTTLTIDLGGKTITRTGTSGNGSAFDVKSGDVLITNGVIACMQDDTAIAADGVYAITSRSGSNVTLEGLAVTVDSKNGACAYPFAGSHVTINSGTYANTTTEPYQYHAGWQGMAVNQANVADKLITINGGTFSQMDPQIGDDSTTGTDSASADFTGPGYVAIEDGSGNWVVQQGWNVTFVNYDGTVLEALRVPAGDAVAYTGETPVMPATSSAVYTFSGWDADIASPAVADATYTAQFSSIYLDPATLAINYNCYGQVAVSNAPAGATFFWTMYTNDVAFSSLSGPLPISSGKTTSALKFYAQSTPVTDGWAVVSITNGAEVITLKAPVTVKDVAAVVDGVEYAKADLDAAAAAALAGGKTLGLYVNGPTVTLAEGQTLVSQVLSERNTPTPSVKAPAGTAEKVYTVNTAIDNATKTRTYTLTYDTPTVMYTSTDGQTVEYLDAKFKMSKDGTYKLLKDVERAQLSVGNVTAVLDLNGHEFSSTVTGSKGAIYVDSLIGNASLTIRDTAGGGSIVAANSFAIQGNRNATISIEGGEIVGKADVVYLSNAADTLTITGGTFRMASGSANFMLNMLDSARGTITVTGGSFQGFDPANNVAEGAGTSFLPATGYVSVADDPEAGWYTVYEAVTVTFVNEKGAAPDAQTIGKGKTAVEPAEPTSELSQFLGWFAEGAEEAFDFDTPVAANLTLTARWSTIGGIAGLDTAQLEEGQSLGALIPITAIETVETTVEGCNGWKITFKPVLKEGIAPAKWLEATLADKAIYVRHAATIEDLVANSENVVVTTVDSAIALQNAVTLEDGSISVVVPVLENEANAKEHLFRLGLAN